MKGFSEGEEGITLLCQSGGLDGLSFGLYEDI